MNKQNATVRRSWGIGLVALASAIGAAGCAVDAGEQSSEPLSEGQPLEPVAPEDHFMVNENSGTGEKACGAVRADWHQNEDYSSVLLSVGDFGGSFHCRDFCPAGSYVYGAQLKSEWAQGAGDDTAVNGIFLDCYDRWTGSYTGTITSGVGPWGTPGTNPVATHVNNPVVGGKAKFQPAAGTAIDDAQVTAAKFRLQDGTWIQPSPSDVVWGSWLQEFAPCAVGKAACGLSTRVEPQQGSGDDTALTGAIMQCCNFPN